MHDGALHGGRVEDFSPAIASGWVAVDVGAQSIEICLRLNGRPVATTRAGSRTDRAAPPFDVRGFRFVLTDLWTYVGPDDAMTVTAEVGGSSHSLEITGHGGAFIPSSTGTRSSAELFAALESGSLFSRTGRLQKSRTLATGWQSRITSTAEKVRALVGEHFGYDVFYAYGSMLGAVREGGFLGHDDDLDLGYLSRHRDADRIGPELRDVALMLVEHGWSVEPFGPLLHVYEDSGERRGQRVDLFPHFFDGDGLLRIPWGMAGTSHVRIEEWDRIVAIPFGTGTAPVPSCAKQVLAQLYGDSWREPQPGFSWSLDRTEKVPGAMMPPYLRDEVYWADFYRRTCFTEPSGFCRAVLAQPYCPPTVFDLGCGDGRDSYAFAAAGRAVLGIDRSPAALERAESKRPHSSTPRDLSFHPCDLTDGEALRELLHRQLPIEGPALYYLRFLHSLTAEDHDALLGVIAEIAQPGDMFAAEFRSLADEGLPKVHKSLNRRFRDGDAMADLLRHRYRFAVLSSDHATGRSVYRAEDPDLHRIIARK